MADELGEDRSRLYRTSSRRLSTPIIITVVLLLLVLLGGGYVFFQSRHNAKPVASPLPSPTVTPTQAPSPTLEATPSGKITPTTTKTTLTPTSKVTPTGTSSSTTERSSVKVTVLNGSGTPGLASKIGDYLTGLGYNVVSTGNADTFDYQGITINVQKSKSTLLPQLKKDLSSQGTITSATATFTGSSDVQVIVGK